MELDNGLVKNSNFLLSGGAAAQGHTKKLVIKNLKGLLDIVCNFAS